METFHIIVLLLDATFRVATPLVLAALAGMFSERAGIVDIGLEGKMLGAAFAAAAVASVSGSAWVGLGAGIMASLALSALHAYACVTHKGNQVVSGMAINIVVAGLAPTLAYAWFRMGGQTPALGGDARFHSLDLPFTEAAREIPVIGYIYAELISGHNIIVYLAAAAVPTCAWALYKTRFGLRVRAVGENPHAVDTAGISVDLLRYKALVVTGFLCGIS
ncbi:MAG: ABC transporter permease, partial [Sneathiella sp.]